MVWPGGDPASTVPNIDVARTAVCVSVCVLDTWKKLYKNGDTDRDVVWGTDWREPKEPCVRWGSDPLTGRSTFEGEMCRPIRTYLDMSAFRTVLLLPPANVPAQRTRWANAMRSCVKLP